MALFSDAVWSLGLVSLLTLVYRAQREEMLGKYPYFYGYLAAVLCSSTLRHWILVSFGNGETYKRVYWISEFVTTLIGFGLTWEIYKNVFAAYGGMRRMTRAIVSSLLVLLLLRGAMELAQSPKLLAATAMEVNRNVEVVQAMLLAAVLVIVLSYSLDIGRNLQSLLFGYGLYIGTNLVTRTVHARVSKVMWPIPTQFEYCVTLIIWCVGMWAYRPVPDSGVSFDSDYERLAVQTARTFERLRDHLLRAWRS